MTAKNVIGIDLGNSNITGFVLPNEEIILKHITVTSQSTIKTNAWVSFNTHPFIGNAAYLNQESYQKTTFYNLNKLISLKYASKEREKISQDVPFELVEVDGKTGIKINNGIYQPLIFRPEQCISFLINGFLSFCEDYKEMQTPVFCFSVLPWWDIYQRQSLFDIASISKISLVSLVNTTTCAAIKYAYDNEKNLKTNPGKVVFIDIGDTSMNVGVIEYTNSSGKLLIRVLSSVCDLRFGGSVLTELIQKEFKNKIQEMSVLKHENIKFTPYSDIRIYKAALESKRNYFSSPQFKVDFYCFQNTYELNESGSDFDKVVKPIANKITEPIKIALQKANTNENDVDNFVMIGSGIRVKEFTNKIKSYLAATNNSDKLKGNYSQCDDYIAKGTTYAAEILSSNIRLSKRFEIKEKYQRFRSDIENNEDITIIAKYNGKEEILFKEGDEIPSKKEIIYEGKSVFVELMMNKKCIGVIQAEGDSKKIEIKLNISQMIEVNQTNGINYTPYYGFSKAKIHEFISMEDKMEKYYECINNCEEIAKKLSTQEKINIINNEKFMTNYERMLIQKNKNYIKKFEESENKVKILGKINDYYSCILNIEKEIDHIHQRIEERKNVFEYLEQNVNDFIGNINEIECLLCEKITPEMSKKYNEFSAKYKPLLKWYYKKSNRGEPFSDEKENLSDDIKSILIEAKELLGKLKKETQRIKSDEEKKEKRKEIEIEEKISKAEDEIKKNVKLMGIELGKTMEEMKTEIDQTNVKLFKTKGEIKTELDKATAKIGQTKGEMDKATGEMKSELVKVTTKINQMKAEMDKATGEINKVKREIEQTKGEMKSELDKATAKINQAKGEMDKATGEINKVKREITKETNLMKETITKLQNDVKTDINNEKKSMKETITKLQNDVKTDINNEKIAMKKAVEQAMKEVNAYRGNGATTEELNNMKEKLVHLEEETAHLKKELDKTKRKLNENINNTGVLTIILFSITLCSNIFLLYLLKPNFLQKK